MTNAALLLQVDTFELMKLWAEFVECYHGVNGHGGDTAEIYAYRFNKEVPLAKLAYRTSINKPLVISNLAQQQLGALVQLFCATYNCKAMIDNITLKNWLSSPVLFDRKVRVCIIKQRDEKLTFDISQSAIQILRNRASDNEQTVEERAKDMFEFYLDKHAEGNNT